MSCSNYDWKAYALGELDASHRSEAEAHAATCANCRDELAALRLTLDTLSILREEEIPRRIAFVSDKVFEPRWWQRVFTPTFAAACVIAAAILVHAFAGPASVDAEVDKAIARVEALHAQQIEQLLADYQVLIKQNNMMYVRNTGMVRQ